MNRWVSYLLRQYGIVLGLLCVAIVLSLLEPRFLTAQNLTNIMRQTSVIGIMAVGMTFVILTAGIDLSVGSVLALSGVVCASLEHHGLPVVAVVAATMLLGAFIGTINGVVITKGKVTPFVVTLGTMSIARGLSHIYTDGQPISGFGAAFRFLGSGTLGNIPVPIVALGAYGTGRRHHPESHRPGSLYVRHRWQRGSGTTIGHPRRPLQDLGVCNLRLDRRPGCHRSHLATQRRRVDSRDGV